MYLHVIKSRIFARLKTFDSWMFTTQYANKINNFLLRLFLLVRDDEHCRFSKSQAYLKPSDSVDFLLMDSDSFVTILLLLHNIRRKSMARQHLVRLQCPYLIWIHVSSMEKNNSYLVPMQDGRPSSSSRDLSEIYSLRFVYIILFPCLPRGQTISD